MPSIPFTSIVQWPFLDCGAPGVEKQMIGVDVVTTAPTGVALSVGYNQRDRTQRTADYTIDADTETGYMVPIPVAGPSFDVKLTFAESQRWEFETANLYIQDMRRGS